jgi:hypothetical protein
MTTTASSETPWLAAWEKFDAQGGGITDERAAFRAGFEAQMNDNAETAVIQSDRTAVVTIFRPSGKYYTSESWRVPAGASGPESMLASPDFHRLVNGSVLVEAEAGVEFPTSKNWGFPYLIA